MDIRFMLAFIFLCVVIIGALAIYIFDLIKNKQIDKVKEWLLLAVVQAEKELGGGTGQIKLRYAYDLFLTKFGWLSNFLSFEVFSMLVDEALIKMKNMLETNGNLTDYINK